MTQTEDGKEVAVVKEQSEKALSASQALVIETAEQMADATDLLSKMKTVGKMIKERKEAITKPLTEALNSARDLFKPIESNLAEAEATMKKKMLAYQAIVDRKDQEARLSIAKKVESGYMKPETAVAKMQQIQAPKTEVKGATGTVQMRSVKKYRIVDETKLAREYLVPNMAKITEALKAGLAVEGAEVYEEKVIASR